jgi:hypothetical protein
MADGEHARHTQPQFEKTSFNAPHGMLTCCRTAMTIGNDMYPDSLNHGCLAAIATMTARVASVYAATYCSTLLTRWHLDSVAAVASPVLGHLPHLQH